MPNRTKLDQQHVVVFGGSSGIGLGIAREALRADACVTIVSRSSDRLASAAATLHGNDRLRTLTADIGSEADVARVLEQAGALDHLVVTAADVAYGPVTDMDLRMAERVIRSKIVGPLLVAKHASRRVRPGGSITFTSGIAAYRPSAGGAVVAMANGAIAALGRALALELAPIRVNVVSPGWVETPIWDVFAGDARDARLQAMAERLPVGRVGSTHDLAHSFIFAMTNAHLTGAVLHVDGGQRLV